MKTYRIILWFAVFLVTLLLSLTDVKFLSPSIINHQDRYFHLLTFFFLAIVTYKLLPSLSIRQIVLITFLFGFLIEVLQFFFTHGTRHFTITDLFFNGLGILLGITWLKLP